MGRKRRKVVRIPKKRLPRIFLCPQCGEKSVKVIIERGQDSAMVQCGKCGLKDQFSVSQAMQPIDVYCKFTDNFYAKVKAA